ncbi:hypothetical protein BDV23DRAFT_183603 [Aspergillus alliaceus]|uniref:Uncharacterized protein n=1 Tax=Petromyces alliaceus TaxID=209559 RepID=A0A5N7C847_PETAA|nr:hypothetical protein BDV23DRAFT_183603 [Aspergillus alliaceus]
MPLPRVALAGATQILNMPILGVFLSVKYSIIALSAIGGISSKLRPLPDLTIREVDFSSGLSLTSAIQGMEVAISCLAASARDSQNPLVAAWNAACEAVRHHGDRHGHVKSSGCTIRGLFA